MNLEKLEFNWAHVSNTFKYFSTFVLLFKLDIFFSPVVCPKKEENSTKKVTVYASIQVYTSILEGNNKMQNY